MYRVTIPLVLNLPLTSKQKFHYGQLVHLLIYLAFCGHHPVLRVVYHGRQDISLKTGEVWLLSLVLHSERLFGHEIERDDLLEME